MHRPPSVGILAIVRPDPKTIFRGFGKFIAVAVVAAAVGAGIGVGLADLTSNDTSTVAAAPATAPVTPAVPPAGAQTAPATPPVTSTTASTTATAAPPATSTTPTQTQTGATPAPGSRLVPRVQIASAVIGKQSTTTQHARVTAQVTVTNRYDHRLVIQPPVLLSGSDQTPLDPDARRLAEPLLITLAPGQSATGTLRFTVSGDVARRLIASPHAQLKVAGRTVSLKLTTTGGG